MPSIFSDFLKTFHVTIAPGKCRRNANDTTKPQCASGLDATDILVIALYIFGICLYTYPLMTDFSRPFSEMGDYLNIAYSLAWQCHALWHFPADFFDANVMFPAKNSLAMATPLNTAQLIFFAPVFALTNDLIKSINAVYCGSIFLCSISMYYVALRIGGTRVGAFVAGWIFAFTLSKIYHNFQLPCFWLVWTLYFWHDFLNTQRLGRLALSMGLFVATALGSFYLMFMGFCGLTAWTIGFHLRIRPIFDRRGILRILAGGLTCILLLLPFGLPYFEVSRTYGLKRPLGEVIQYSADPILSYFLPNNRSVLYDHLRFGTQYHAWPIEERLFDKLVDVVSSVAGPGVFGKNNITDDFSYRDFHEIWNAGTHERRAFLGYSVLVLLILGWIVKLPQEHEDQRYFWRLLLVVSFTLSLGPVVVVIGHLTYIPGPYAILYYLVPGMEGIRAVARFSFMANLAASVLAMYGWKHVESLLQLLCSNRKHSERLVLGIALTCWMVLFTAENLPATNLSHERPAEAPAVYDWLATQEITGGVVEIPTFKGDMRKNDLEYGSRRVAYAHREYMYMYYSTNHWKPIYNGFGAFISPIQFRIRNAVEQLPQSEAVAYLKGLGLHTFILHRPAFEKEDHLLWIKPEVREIFELLTSIDGSDVYRLK